MKESDRQLKAAVYEQIARIGRAIASPRRLELLDLLSQGPRTVEALARGTGQTVANTSHHLQVLRRARLVDAEKAGLHVTYRLAAPKVAGFLVRLQAIAASRLAELDRLAREYLQDRSAMEAIGRSELVRRVRTGEVTLVDVRPREEYVAAHIPGAISIPLGELKRRLGELPRDRDVVAYCRGPYCVMALDAVAVLRRSGLRAHRLEDGVNEWRARGWRVEAGAPAASPS